METIEQIKERDLPHGQIQFVITVGEESGLVGAKALDTQLLDADFGYAVDASKDVGTTVVGAPTQMKIYTTIKGKTAHASTPTKGVSAINIAAKAISRMKLGQIDKLTTANIGNSMVVRLQISLRTKSFLKLKHVLIMMKVFTHKSNI